MTEHTTNMLAAFHLAVHIANVGPYDVGTVDIEIVDIAVANAGNRLFGEGWTAVKHARGVPYAPVVSMALGRMQMTGLVRAGEVAALGVLRYRSWAFTDEGRALAEQMFGPADEMLGEPTSA